MRADAGKLKDIRMPRFSWDYEDFPKAEHWFLMADAYMDICQFVLSEMTKEQLDSSFHHAKVAVSLFEHAIELFLKASICQAGAKVPAHHKMDKLYRKYIALFPGNDFAFQGKIQDFVKPSAMAPHNLYARYPGEKNGKPWQGHTHIDISIWYREADKFLSDFKRLKPLIKEQYKTTKNPRSGF